MPFNSELSHNWNRCACVCFILIIVDSDKMVTHLCFLKDMDCFVQNSNKTRSYFLITGKQNGKNI